MLHHRRMTSWGDFYPRPPRGGRRFSPPPWGGEKSLISIHALREEGDHNDSEWSKSGLLISIHPLREEGDGVA